jgi:pSer/pThr/pTyr-binding forkhead associated (FHA) protein
VPPNSEQSALPRPHTALELKAVIEAERSGVPFLLFRDGRSGQQLFLMDAAQRVVTIGRGPGVDIALDWDEHVSAVHAEIAALGAEWTIADEGLSRNGTFVNGQRLHGRRRLRVGDVIRLGETTLLYTSAPSEAPVSTITLADPLTVERITDAQRRVLNALCRPYRDRRDFVTPATNQQIAQELFLSIEAVKTHLRQLYLRFALDHLPQNEKRARLAERALELGLVTFSDP